MNLDLEKDLVQEINNQTAVISYDLPYALTTSQWENLELLVENAPIVYSMDAKESPCYQGGTFLVFERID